MFKRLKEKMQQKNNILIFQNDVRRAGEMSYWLRTHTAMYSLISGY